MTSLSTIQFYKQATCPAAETLLAYHTRSLALARRRVVASHLAACEFCGAELQLLADHPPDDGCDQLLEITAEAMPLGLRRLAEAILSGSTRTIMAACFAKPSYEKRPVALIDA
jgi:hypothetical protein